jgi:hypothetical protein
VQSPRPKSARNPKTPPGARRRRRLAGRAPICVATPRCARGTAGRVFARREALDREALRAGMSYMTEHVDGYHHLREDALFALLCEARSRPGEVHREGQARASVHRRRRQAADCGAGTTRADRPRRRSRADLWRRRLCRRHADALWTSRKASFFPAPARFSTRTTSPRSTAPSCASSTRSFEASLQSAYAAYSPLVRYLAKQPVLQQVVGALEQRPRLRLDARRDPVRAGRRCRARAGARTTHPKSGALIAASTGCNGRASPSIGRRSYAFAGRR